MTRHILITGASSGIGLGLARTCLAAGDKVLAVQRRSSPLVGSAGYQEVLHDLTDYAGTGARVAQLVGSAGMLDLVVLNAGTLGRIEDMADVSIAELQQTMAVNAWANKALLDALFALPIPTKQVVGMSSGAAVSGNRGWSGYALSKATFLMMLKLYAAEHPRTHFTSFAPGLVDTGMQDYLCGLGKDVAVRFPSVASIQARRGTQGMPSPEEVGARFVEAFRRLLAEPSGSFIDIRKWDKAPEA